MKFYSTLAIAIAALVSQGATASPDDGIYLIPMAGHMNFGDDRNLDDTEALGMGVGKQLNNRWGVELGYLDSDTEADNTGTDIESGQWRIDGIYSFNTNGNWQPYLASGVGDARFDAEGIDSSRETLVNFGGGIKYFFTESLAARAGIRAFHSIDESETDVAALLSLNYWLQNSPAKVEPAKVKPTLVLDDDNDGVPNSKDQCLTTPKGAKVDANGCAADSDSDGIADYKDKCLSTPQGLKVDSSGCTLDSDGDGIADSLDKCPNTSKKAKVDKNGCHIVIEEAVKIDLNLQFDNNSAAIKDSHLAEIKNIADFMENYPGTKVVIEGHTDDRGAASYNKSLSQRRAEAVATALVKRYNVAANRVTSVGYGEEQPIASNDTLSGRQQNRRVFGVVSETVKKEVYQ